MPPNPIPIIKAPTLQAKLSQIAHRKSQRPKRWALSIFDSVLDIWPNVGVLIIRIGLGGVN